MNEKNKITWHTYTDCPPEKKLVYVKGLFIRGVYAMVNNMWYSEEEIEDQDYDDIDGFDADAVEKWTWLPDDTDHSEDA